MVIFSLFLVGRLIRLNSQRILAEEVGKNTDNFGETALDQYG
jgi:hypothetical protein